MTEYVLVIVSDIAIFVLKRDVKLQPTNHVLVGHGRALPRYSLRSVNRTRLAVPPIKLSTYGGRCFSVSGPTVWNSLPDYLTEPTCTIYRRISALSKDLRPNSITLSC